MIEKMKSPRFCPQLINSSLENRLCPSSITGAEVILNGPVIASSVSSVNTSIRESSADDAINGSGSGAMPMFMAMVMKPTTGMISENEAINGDAMASVKSPALPKMRDTGSMSVAMPVAMVPQAMPAMPVMPRRTSGRQMPESDAMQSEPFEEKESNSGRQLKDESSLENDSLMPEKLSPDLEPDVMQEAKQANLDASGVSMDEKRFLVTGWLELIESINRIFVSMYIS